MSISSYFSQYSEGSNYSDDSSLDEFALWNQKYSDDRSMQRRNPVRRQRNALDHEQTKDAMKLLEKYVRRKYMHSMVLSQDAGDNIDQSATPVGHTQSACYFTREMTPAERLSHVFNSTPIGPIFGDLNFEPTSPVFSPVQETSFRAELKHKETESWSSYFYRIAKSLYEILGVHYIILAVLIIGYACLGGWIFMNLEDEQQKLDSSKERKEMIDESRILAKNLLSFMKRFNCSSTNDGLCLRLLTKAFVERSDRVDQNIRGEGWKWDYWNSVFFSATIFTTIGYGNLTCKTKFGRIVTIIYGLIGIPLMLFVLKMYGELAIKYAQKIRFFLKRQFRKYLRRIRKGNLNRANTIESVASFELQNNMNHDLDEPGGSENEEENMFTTFPVKWALFIVLVFIIISSFIVSFWEKWDFLTAFYFFFVSLSTIGFGDVIPEHPRTACGLFILYFVGLALFSMVYAILQERVENQYMWALELIDQEYQENQKCDIENEDIDVDEKSTLLLDKGNANVRWRQNNSAQSMGNMPDRPESARRFSVFTNSESSQFPPPVLGAFMFHNMSIKKKFLARSESILNKNSMNRPTSLFPTTESINNTNVNWLNTPDKYRSKDEPSLGKSAGTSAPNLSGGNRSPSGALSVITEASDEDCRFSKKNICRKVLEKTEETDETLKNSNESLDQVMPELQLDSHDNDPSPQPHRDPSAQNFTKLERS